MSFITEFYLGSNIPSNKRFKPGSDYDKVLHAVLECENRLENELGEELKQHFTDMIDAHDEFLNISVLESFTDGFRIGAAFTLDTFAVNDCGVVDIQKK